MFTLTEAHRDSTTVVGLHERPAPRVQPQGRHSCCFAGDCCYHRFRPSQQPQADSVPRSDAVARLDRVDGAVAVAVGVPENGG